LEGDDDVAKQIASCSFGLEASFSVHGTYGTLSRRAKNKVQNF
jgi:hypothetical protein